MKFILGTLGVVVTLLWFAYIVGDIHASYVYDNRVESYWELSVKASTLDTKADYLNKFVDALDRSNLSGNGAWIWKTPNSDYYQNYVTLKSLQTRMQETKSMNLKSFEYQQAISQITAQEQDEAGKLLAAFKDVWFKCNYTIYWGPYELFGLLGLAVIAATFIFAGIAAYDYN